MKEPGGRGGKQIIFRVLEGGLLFVSNGGHEEIVNIYENI